MSEAVHATVAARSTPHGWRAVMLTGAPGVGKSDLLLRLLADGWRLIADDYAALFASADAVYATAPAPLSGRIEVRGQGILACPPLPVARVVLAAVCDDGSPERLPDSAWVEVAGVRLPRLDIRPLEASAPARIGVAFRRFCSPAD